MQVIITDEAEESLDEIIEYLRENWNETVVKNFISNIKSTIKRIQKIPNGFPKSQFVDAQRALVSKQIVLLFRIENNTIIVLLFWDGRQNPDYLKLK